jgi:hypothetical protein
MDDRRIEDIKTTQWLKEKVQKDKKQSTKLAKSCGLDNSDDDAEVND